jgi:hypothetical protein
MKISQICAVAVLLSVGSLMAFADGITDPKIIIHGVNSGSASTSSPCGPHGCEDVGLSFSFTIPKSGHGFLYFTNTSGKNWTSLTLIETGVPAADISCTQTVFLNCSTKTLGNGSVEILLSGANTHRINNFNPRTGIANGQSFDIGFRCLNGSCWPGGSTVTAHAGAVPEPSTVAFMLTGLGAIVSRRKTWMNRLKA